MLNRHIAWGRSTQPLRGLVATIQQRDLTSRVLPLPSQCEIASVLEGERLMKNVYESLRQGPKWNSTLYVLTYDEHGGFYDHVPPPQEGVPNPDGINTTKGFTYERLGIRIPTIAISPWIEKGVLISEPTGAQKQQPTSQWSLRYVSSGKYVLSSSKSRGDETASLMWACNESLKF